MNATTMRALAACPEQLEAHYAAIPEEFKNWAPASWEDVPSEPFTPIEQPVGKPTAAFEISSIEMPRQYAERSLIHKRHATPVGELKLGAEIEISEEDLDCVGLPWSAKVTN